MKNYQSILLLLLIISPLILSPIGIEGGKRRVHITDDLDDVVDDEEDEDWKEWGKKKYTDEFDPPPDFDDMDFAQIQEEMAKRQMGPAFGFVKLRLGIPREKKRVAEIAIRWTQILRTGAYEVKFTGMDLGTVMFNIEDSQRIPDLKEFILSQDEAYEVKVGNQVYRRPGDPPFEELVRRSKENDEHVKEEL